MNLQDELLLEGVRKVVREELDRKPDGWDAYAKACVAAFETRERPYDSDWSVRVDQAYEVARALRPKP